MQQPTDSSSLIPTMYLGISRNVKGNGEFVSDESTVHVSGKLIVQYNIISKCQKLIKHPTSSHEINMMSVCAKKCHLVIAEKGQKPSLSVYSLTNYRRLVVLGNPIPTSTCKMFSVVYFIMEDKNIIALTGKPDWLIITFEWEVARVLVVTKACYTNFVANVSDVLVNPKDNSVISIVGEGIFRYMNFLGGSWRQFGFHKIKGVTITTACWVDTERILVGTNSRKLMLFSYTALLTVYDALSVTIVELRLAGSGQNIFPRGEIIEKRAGVYLMRQSHERFVYSCKRGTVHVFAKRFIEKDQGSMTLGKEKRKICHSLERLHLLKVPSLSTRNVIDRFSTLLNVSISERGDLIICTTNGGQLLISPVVVNNRKKSVLYFRLISSGFNKKEVSCVASCLWRPLFLTCACDKRLKLYDYYKNSTCVIKQFKSDIIHISLHPTGSFGLLGFYESMIFFSMRGITFQLLHCIGKKNSKLCEFSSEGSIFGVVLDFSIMIYDSAKLLPVYEIKEVYASTITQLIFDKSLDFIWIKLHGDMISKLNINDGCVAFSMKVHNSVEFVMDREFNYFYTISKGGVLSAVEISTGSISWAKDLEKGSPVHVCLSDVSQCFFIGMEDGSVWLLEYPFLSSSLHETYRVHRGFLRKMAIAKDFSHMLTSDSNGVACVWKIVGKMSEKNKLASFVKKKCTFVEVVPEYIKKIQYIVDIESKRLSCPAISRFYRGLREQKWETFVSMNSISLFDKTDKVGLYFPKYVCKSHYWYDKFKYACIEAVKTSLVDIFELYSAFEGALEFSSKKENAVKRKELDFETQANQLCPLIDFHLYLYSIHADIIMQQMLFITQQCNYRLSSVLRLQRFIHRALMGQRNKIFRKGLQTNRHILYGYLKRFNLKIIGNLLNEFSYSFQKKKIKNIIEASTLLLKMRNLPMTGDTDSSEVEKEEVSSYDPQNNVVYNLARYAFAKLNRNVQKHICNQEHVYLYDPPNV